MAVNKKKHNAAWDALVTQDAAEVRRFNPHIGAQPQPYPDDEYAELVDDARRLATVWDEIDQQRQQAGHPPSYTAADAVDEDRRE
jgi:hypothetical protein